MRANDLSVPKCTISRTGKVGRPSHCGAYRQRVEKQLDLGLSAQRIYQDLKVECGNIGSHASGQRQTEIASIGSLQASRRTTNSLGFGLN